jgi:hypothetical protein
MTRQEKRSREKEVRRFQKGLQNERYLIYYPEKMFDEDIGQDIDFLVSHCPYCKSLEPTIYNLAEWSHKQKRLVLKITRRDATDGMDDFDFCCFAERQKQVLAAHDNAFTLIHR